MPRSRCPDAQIEMPRCPDRDAQIEMPGSRCPDRDALISIFRPFGSIVHNGNSNICEISWSYHKNFENKSKKSNFQALKDAHDETMKAISDELSERTCLALTETKSENDHFLEFAPVSKRDEIVKDGKLLVRLRLDTY